MYTAFTHARKEVPHHSLPTSGNRSGEPWNSDSEEAHQSKSLGKTFVENDKVEPIPANTLDANNTKGKEYDMPDGLKVPANLKAYDGMSDPDDHLTVFMDESLKDYVTRFSKETLHMADRSDVMVSGAFISGLRPERLFKDLIARPSTSLEDLFT
ncbi:hypothetical protein Tco_0815058 [Tanacetum coccineum]